MFDNVYTRDIHGSELEESSSAVGHCATLEQLIHPCTAKVFRNRPSAFVFIQILVRHGMKAAYASVGAESR